MLGSEHLAEYAWMHEIDLEDGRRLQSYKHLRSRRYLHLDGYGKRWLYRHGRYKESGSSSGLRSKTSGSNE